MAAKSINLMTRQRVRKLAGKLMEEWQNLDDVADVLGCHPNNVRRWHIEYKANDSEKNGSAREPGRPSKLTVNQQNIIEDIILTKTPEEMNHPNTLWSNTVIRDVIYDLFRTELCLATVNSMTHKMGIARRQIFRHRQDQADEGHKAWLKCRFPFIRKLARESSARILFIHDEVVNTTGPQTAKTHPKSDPDRGVGTPHCDIHVLSAICPRNSQRFMTFLGPLRTHAFI